MFRVIKACSVVTNYELLIFDIYILILRVFAECLCGLFNCYKTNKELKTLSYD